MIRQEIDCFLERCHLREEQLIAHNLPDTTCDDLDLAEFDAVLIGGAGAISALDDFGWTPAFHKFVRSAIDRGVPMFGCCWGHQAITRIMGGEVVHDSARAELGCRWMQRTDAAAEDPLFGPLPDRFLANTGHHDRVARLPEQAVELSFNNSQRFQAFKLKNKPVYGTQFHSELDAERERERLVTYRDYYRRDLPSNEAFQAVLDGLKDTPYVDDLLYRFLQLHAT